MKTLYSYQWQVNPHQNVKTAQNILQPTNHFHWLQGAQTAHHL
jgi:hypothetical protein